MAALPLAPLIIPETLFWTTVTESGTGPAVPVLLNATVNVAEDGMMLWPTVDNGSPLIETLYEPGSRLLAT